MKIIADQQIPLVAEAFSGFGDVSLLPGRSITPKDLSDCDILLVRSVTGVNQELLENSPIQFVASATSGIDHIDVDYLQDRGTGFSHAPGCNARSVAEYVLAALVQLQNQSDFNLQNKSVGIIGYGHVGSRVARFLDAIGLQCVINDPPLASLNKDSGYFCSLDEALACDIVTLHVPLTNSGDFPTRQMINEKRINQIPDGAVLINTARGEAIDETALLNAVKQGKIRAIIDVWQNEPDINTELLKEVSIGTPHIAGYSLDGRYRAAEKIYLDCCTFFNQAAEYVFPVLPVSDYHIEQASSEQILARLINSIYPIARDNESMKQIINMSGHEDRCRRFDQLRKTYPERREFNSMRVGYDEIPADLIETITKLGFLA